MSKNTRVQCTVEGYCTQTSVAVSTVYRYLCFCFLNVLLCLSVMVMNTTDSFHHVWHSWTWLWKCLKTFWSCWTTGTYNWLVETYTCSINLSSCNMWAWKTLHLSEQCWWDLIDVSHFSKVLLSCFTQELLESSSHVDCILRWRTRFCF